ncbi:hypothetical protein AAMO2058_000003000 [Amorphochlora amoebiformis]
MDTKHIEEVEEEHEEIKSAKGNKTFADIAGAEMEIHEEINADPDRKVAGGHLEGGEGEIPEELTDKEVKLNVNLKSDIPEELPGHDDEGKEGKEIGAEIKAVQELIKTETKLDDLRMMSEAADLNELMARATEERGELLVRNSKIQKEIQQFWETDRRSQAELKDQKFTTKSTDILSEQKVNYKKNLESIKSLVQNIERKSNDNLVKIDKLENTLKTLDRRAQTINQAFKTFKREIAAGSVNQQTGKLLKPKRTLALESAEAAKDKEVEGIRLTNIHHVNKLSKLISQVRKKEELADGLHMIDFEQLKIENQTLSEKIEERNDELHKLIKKTRSTVEVLTHVKEKLQFVQQEESALKKKLETLEGKRGRVTLLLDRLMKVKKIRDSLREELVLLQGQAGFVGSDVLVSDYEKRKLTIEALKSELDELQQKHKGLTETTKKLNKSRRKKPEDPNVLRKASANAARIYRRPNSHF